jgi:DNA repair protein RecN (Recombination protein N)
MLTELVVEGLGVIDRAELHLSSGSSALTGETGAGKTLLVAALGLLLGARSDKNLVRQGATAARVDARFELTSDHPAMAALQEQELVESDASEVILSRSVGADGKSKARINGRPITLAILQEVGRSLVEIAGQNEHHELNSPTAQRELLDSFAGQEVQRLAADVAREVSDLMRARAQLEASRSSERDRARELDILTFEIKEIDEAGLRTGELAELTEAAGKLEHADAIAQAISAATQKLKGDSGIGELLAGAVTDIELVQDKDPTLTPLLDRLRSIAIEVADVVEELARASVQSDPALLASTRDRLAQLNRLLKKYGASEEEVLSYLARSKERADAIGGSDLAEERLLKEIEVAERRAMDTARKLSDHRRRAAQGLKQRIEVSLADLALADARFEVEFSERELYQGGLEAVQFSISANVGEAPRPLAKVASGGELSRISLALRLLARSGSATTMVFDEVDAGVGGEAARAVGRYLAELGERDGAQVLVVTHLPQVAAFAENQYRVSKSTAGDRTASLVEKIEGEARVEELSRMLAGLPESERAREHAQELLEIAGRQGRS